MAAFRARLLRRYSTSRPFLTGVWLVVIVGLEVFGRRSASDASDALGVGVLVGLASLTALAHHQRRLPSVDGLLALGRRIAGWLARYRVRMGVDLRETPPLPRSFPRVYLALVALVVSAFALVVRFAGAFPGTVRDGLLSVSPSVYFLYLTLLWGTLSSGALILLFYTFLCVHDWVISTPRFQVPHRRAIEAWSAGAFVGLAAALATTLPRTTPLVLIGAAMLVIVVLMAWPGNPEILVVWKQQPEAEPKVAPWTRLVSCYAIMIACIFALLVLLGAGDRLVGSASSTTPVTAFLGGAAAWTGAAAYLAWAWVIPFRVFTRRYRNPSRPCPATVRVEGVSPEDAQTLAAFSEAGFHVRLAASDGPKPDDVNVKVDANAPRVGPDGVFESRPTWPLQVHPSDLGHGEVHHEINRRDEIQRRRRFFRGLEKLMRFASRRRFEHGRGTWIAPHLWYIGGLARDANEEDSWSVGPPFHTVMTHAARNHLYRVLRAAEIDLIFVEDGVTFRQLKRVFRTLFDHYDLFGGAGRAEEQHFNNLPGLRVVIHEFTMDRPFRATRYPDVDYEEIGRGRILHVFKDRGEPDESPEVPIDSDLVPEPAAVG